MADTAQVLTPRRELRLVRDGETRTPHGDVAPSVGSLRDLRLTRRGWWVLSLVAVALVALGMVLGDRAVASSPGEAVSVGEHYVAQGETLWRIAGGVAQPGEDVRDVVDLLVELNGRPSTALQVGERILVPLR